MNPKLSTLPVLTRRTPSLGPDRTEREGAWGFLFSGSVILDCLEISLEIKEKLHSGYLAKVCRSLVSSPLFPLTFSRFHPERRAAALDDVPILKDKQFAV